MEEVIVPVVLFVALVGAIWLFSHYNYKKRLTTHETLRLSIDKGQDLSPDLIEKMSYLSDPVKADLRRGVLLIAFGLAFITLGLIVPHDEPEAIRGIVGISAFPMVLGLAYLALWRFSHDR